MEEMINTESAGAFPASVDFQPGKFEIDVLLGLRDSHPGEISRICQTFSPVSIYYVSLLQGRFLTRGLHEVGTEARHPASTLTLDHYRTQHYKCDGTCDVVYHE
jgi:hypothetical protein